MATEARIAANRQNAQSSTGSRTGQCKSRSSQNRATSGLFSACDLVRPSERDEYSQLRDAFWLDLRPEGPLQQTTASEIVSAAWRLRRCAVTEDMLAGYGENDALDPMQNPETSPIQNSVDQDVVKSLAADNRRKLQQRKLDKLDSVGSMFGLATAWPASDAPEQASRTHRAPLRHLAMHPAPAVPA